MNSELIELAEWAYRGELRGDVLFGELASAQSDHLHADELRTLQLLELQTGEALRGLVERLGGDTSASEGNRVVALRMAGAGASLPWDDFIRLFGPTTSEALEKYRRLRELVDEADQALVDEVIAHEEALQAFADASLAGNDDPLACVVALLRQPWRSQVPAPR